MMPSLSQIEAITHEQKRSAYKNYKITTADISQVCDWCGIQYMIQLHCRDDGGPNKATSQIASDTRKLLSGLTLTRAKCKPPCCDDDASSTESSPFIDNSSTSDLQEPRERGSCPNSEPSEKHDRQTRSLIRQKHQPRHRSTSLNNSISGIMKPSRYLIDAPQRSFRLGRKSSIDASIGSLTDDTSSHSCKSWVPSGVVFSPIMEVLAYKIS